MTCVLGLICQFTAFTQTNFLVLVITFFLFGLAMVMFAFFMTTLVRTARIGILLGIFIFVIGLLFESFVFSSAFLGYIWWDSGTGDAGWIGMFFVVFLVNSSPLFAIFQLWKNLFGHYNIHHGSVGHFDIHIRSW